MVNQELLKWCLAELASREEQERLWLGLTEGEMSSIEEVRCGIFDDSGLMRAIESGYLRESYSQEFCEKVNSLHEMLKLLPENSSPSVVIAHPKMEDVRILAGEILALLNRDSNG